MISKFLRITCKYNVGILLTRRVTPIVRNVRHMELIPPSQYDIPYPNRLRLGYALRHNWEIIPLFLSTCASLSIMFFTILWTCKNKVDVVFTSHSRENISRTMNLRDPSVHKFIIINQRYEPWPEMQDVLDKMRMAEKRALTRAQSCANP